MLGTAAYKYRLLAVDDHPGVLESIRLILGDQIVFTGVSQPDTALELIQCEQFDIVISDYDLKADINGIEIVKRAQRRNPFVAACLMTANEAAPIVRDVFEAFGGIFIEKPFCEDAFLPILERARRNRMKWLAVSGDVERGQEDHFSGIVAETPSMIKLLDAVRKCAPHHTLSIHMTGPTGTGKSTLAEIVHRLSIVKGKFVTVNCAGLEELAMSRLFGHSKGAFTGAIKDHEGFIKQADGGTLFLDELHLLSRDVQGKLLRVLQDGVYQRLGETIERTSRFRLITAASVDVRKQAELGSFIPDLWYRISGKILVVPSLAERKACIPRMVYQLLKKIALECGREYEIEPAALDLLVGFSWEGNIRDLSNCVRSVCTDLYDRTTITADMVRDDLSQRAGKFGEDLAGISRGETLLDACNQFERSLIRKAIHRHSGNLSHAARTLGVPRNTLRGRMERLGLQS